MKILVTSDMHCSKRKMQKVLSLESYDAVVFLGDGSIEKVIDNKQSTKPLFAVKGNRDVFSKLPKFLNFTLDEVRFFATHGNINGGTKPENLLNYAEKNSLGQKMKVILFGHTHKQFSKKIKDTLLLNPGSIKNNEYAIVVINEGKIKKTYLKSFKN